MTLREDGVPYSTVMYSEELLELAALVQYWLKPSVQKTCATVQHIIGVLFFGAVAKQCNIELSTS